MDQSARLKTLSAFRANEITYLIASDVAARGLDIPEVSHVFNYDVPTHAEDYVHRIGRTGRAGREGWAFTMVTKEEAKQWKAIEQLIKKEIPFFDLGEEAQAAIETRAAEPDRPRREGRGERGERRGSRERDRRPREVKDHGERAAMHPAERVERPVAPEAEKPERVKAERERPERKPREARAEQPRSEAPAPKREREREREPRRDRHPQQDVSDAPDHRGFTDQNMPAFLMRSVKVG
jgi:superfamily II DNA/RNA helicase